MQGLKDVTNNVHYENFRCQKLAGVSGVSSPDPKKFSAPSRYVYVCSSSVGGCGQYRVKGHRLSAWCRCSLHQWTVTVVCVCTYICLCACEREISLWYLLPPLSLSLSVRDPLAQFEVEKREHELKMKKMEAEMEQVFEMKVQEKMQKLKDIEADVSTCITYWWDTFNGEKLLRPVC